MGEHHRVQMQLQELEKEYKSMTAYMERIRASALHNVHLKYLNGHNKRKIYKFVEAWRDAHVWKQSELRDTHTEAEEEENEGENEKERVKGLLSWLAFLGE